MDFQLTCTCGQSVMVSEGAAGSAVQCSCGREVFVPSLDELRKQAGLTPYRASAALVIQDLLQRRELPGTTVCAGCAEPSDATAMVIAECEQMGSQDSADLVAILLGAFFSMLPAALHWRVRESEGRGNTLTLRLPVALCHACRRPLERGTLRSLLPHLQTIMTILFAGWLLQWLAFPHPFVEPITGIPLFCGLAFVVMFHRRVQTGEQAALRKLLASVPVYQELLNDYPTASLHLEVSSPTPAVSPR